MEGHRDNDTLAYTWQYLTGRVPSLYMFKAKFIQLNHSFIDIKEAKV